MPERRGVVAAGDGSRAKEVRDKDDTKKKEHEAAREEEEEEEEEEEGRDERQREAEVAPAQDWGLDPLFWCHVTLLVGQILALRRDETTKCDHVLEDRHPVSRAEILGIVVRIDVRDQVVKYAVDDGTGVIDCVDWRRNTTAMNTLRIDVQTKNAKLDVGLGSRVRVLGKLKINTYAQQRDAEESKSTSNSDSFRNRWPRELIVTTMDVVADPNAEILHFARAKHLMETVYSRPCNPAFAASWRQHFGLCNGSGSQVTSSQGARDASAVEIAERTESLLGDLLLRHVEQRERESRSNGRESAGDGAPSADVFFTLRDFVEEQTVWKEAQRRTGLPPNEARKHLNGALLRLVNGGKLYHIKDLYGLISADNVIIPAILLVLDRFDREEGVSMYELLKTLHADERLRFVAQEAVESALSRLQGVGDVYEPKRRRFRLVAVQVDE